MSKNNILKKLSPLHIVAFICAAVIFVTVVVSAVLFGISMSEKNNREFDYMKENLEEYITLGDYTNLTVTPAYSTIRPVDVEAAVLNLIAGQKNYSATDPAYYDENTVINVGDVVNLYYRGYILDEEGNPEYVDGMSNLIGSTYATMKPYSLSIGGDSFISGFSLALDGKVVKQYPKMETNRGEKVEVKAENTIAFVSFTRYPITTNKYSHVETQGSVETGTSVLVDLTLGQAEIDAIYGEGFYAAIVGVVDNPETEENETVAAAKANGENVISDTTKGLRANTAEGVDYKYTKIAVEYTMAADYYAGYETIEVQFPESYSAAELAGKDAYFQIIIESVQEYRYEGHEDDSQKDDITLVGVNSEDETVRANARAVINPILKIALEKNEEFAEYLKEAGVVVPEENDTTDYYHYYTEYLKHEYEESKALTNELALYQAIIDAIVESTTVVKPHPDLEDKYNASLITFRSSYTSNGSSYATIEEYAEAVIGGDHYVYIYEENGEWKVLVDADKNPCAPEEGDTVEYTKLYDWKAAVKQLSVEYYTERMAIYQIIKANNLYNEDSYKAAYDRIYNDYANEYKKSYCDSYGIDIDNMTTQEEAEVEAAVKSYISSEIGYEYLSDRAYYQLVFDFLADKITVVEE